MASKGLAGLLTGIKVCVVLFLFGFQKKFEHQWVERK
jgi:hypothetical protein